MEGIINFENIRPYSKKLNNILTKNNYKSIVIAIAYGWEIESEIHTDFGKYKPEWTNQNEYLSHLWSNHHRVNPFFHRNINKTCTEMYLTNPTPELLYLKNLILIFSKNIDRNRNIQNKKILANFETLKNNLKLLMDPNLDHSVISKSSDNMHESLDRIIQDWKENNNYIFFEYGKWRNRHLDTIADPLEFLSDEEVEAFYSEIDQTENQLEKFEILRLEISERLSNIKNRPLKYGSLITNLSTTTGFKSSLTDVQIVKLFEQMQTYIEGNLNNFKATFKNEPFPPNFSIKWIDRGKTRHEPNKQTLFEFFFLLKEYGYLEKSNFDTTSTNQNNLYRKLETIFPEINNFPASNPTAPQRNTPRQKELEAIILSLES